MRTGLATAYLRWVRDLWRMGAFRGSGEEQGAILIVLFHGLFRSRQEAQNGVCDPQQGITVAFFTEFVESLLAQGVAIRELEDAVRHPRPGRTAVITFDDGYFSNVHALEVLKQFDIPATFFISTKHVQEQKSFWWDVTYREATRRGLTASVVRKQVQKLKLLRAEEVELRIIDWYGAQAFTPVSDCDRPFNPDELGDFASSRHVFLGNHTSDHAILINYDPPGMQSQIEEAQRFLTDVTGTAPRSIAYPNGNYNAKVVEVAQKAGLELGLTVRTGMNRTPTRLPMELRRLTIWGTPDAVRQGMALGTIGRARDHGRTR